MNKSVRTCLYDNDLIRRPYVNLISDGVPFYKFAEECSKNIGGSPEEWMERNKSMLGLFDTKNKKLNIGARFKVPNKIVDKAINKYVSTSSLSPDTRHGTSSIRMNKSTNSSFTTDADDPLEIRLGNIV